MDQQLTLFLQRYAPLTEETVLWGDGTLPLSVRCYLSAELPPLSLITSVRSVVLRDNAVMVVRGPDEDFYVLPGGRREAGETLLQTLQREVLEEVGWTLKHITLLGFLHFQHLGPRPLNYRYSYPDFFQAIYASQAEQFVPEAMQEDVFVVSSSFQPLDELQRFHLSASDQRFLDAASGLQWNDKDE